MDNVEVPNWVQCLPLAPEFRPTDTEFADPIAYISKIEKQASVYGICKVIPPLPKPSKRYVFNNLNESLLKSRKLFSSGEGRAVFSTRQQELGRKTGWGGGGAVKGVWHSGEEYTLEEFESKAKGFSRSVLGKIKDVTPRVVEGLFWKACDEKPVYVEYANDVPGSGFEKPKGLSNYCRVRRKRRRRVLSQSFRERGVFGNEGVGVVGSSSSGVERKGLGSSLASCFEPGKECVDRVSSSSNATLSGSKQGDVSSSGEVEGTAGWKLSNSPWNLQVIARSAGSLTRFMLDDIPGVTSPMVYIGMLFSWFAWHVEDHELHSLNFLHMGSPKTWYAVPGDYAFDFEELIRRQAYGGDFDNLASLKLLGEKTTLLSPEYVISSGIPCCRLVQNPGEFVVTFPRAYHVGFSHGFNCGEAANFGTPQWLSVARDAAVRRAAMDHLPMLSHQQLLYLLAMSFITRIPKSLLAGVRSSRLRDCLKKERELLVKKAFFEDMMKENNQLNNLLGKDVSFRAVLWHPDSLPSFTKDSLSPIDTAPDAMQSKHGELSVIHEKDAGPDSLTRQPASFMEIVDDFYLDTDDISSEFQVDSGTLPCVACGILGYPYMCVIQPSKKAATEIFHAENLPKTRDTAESPNLANNITEEWDTSGPLRPRIFCLEHAIQIEELLRLIGGARMLIICHSDFQRIKANAVAIAEDIGVAFRYNEVVLDSASKEELNLIDLAIDREHPSNCREDWTSKLGMNLRFTIKSRIMCPPKMINHAPNVKYLLSIIAPGSVISTIEWCSRKPRSKRDLTCGKHLKLDNNHSKVDEIIREQGDKMETKEKVLLQYSRRKYRMKAENCSGAKCVSGYSMQCPSKVDASKPDTLETICVENMEADLEELCTIEGEERMHDGGSIVAALVDPLPIDVLVVDSNLPVETSVSTLVNPTFPEKTTLNNDADSTSEDLSTGNCCNPLDTDISNMEKSVIVDDEKLREEIDGLAVTSEPMTVRSPREICSIQDGRDLDMSNISNDMCYTTYVADSNMPSENNMKRAREVVQETGGRHRNFVRSPCEGLRPRNKKEDSISKTKCHASASAEQEKPLAKKSKKSSGLAISSCSELKDGNKRFKCEIDGCVMYFKTSAELSSHKHNKCHYEECGKKFRSHGFVVLHQKVHDDERPLRCTWKGCDMTFKWGWARTKHLRHHMG